MPFLKRFEVGTSLRDVRTGRGGDVRRGTRLDMKFSRILHDRLTFTLYGVFGDLSPGR